MLERGLEGGREGVAPTGQSEESPLSAMVGMVMMERSGREVLLCPDVAGSAG